jgi:hypothetical protein
MSPIFIASVKKITLYPSIEVLCRNKESGQLLGLVLGLS